MIAAVSSVAILAVIAAFHFYWAAGGRFGCVAAIPEKDGVPVFTPRPLGTALVAAAILAAAALVAVRARLLPIEPLFSLSEFAVWALAFVFAVRAVGDFHYVGFFKTVRQGRFAPLDTYIYSPLCCLLAVQIAAVALQG